MSAERKRFDKKWKGRAYPEVIAEDVTKLRARITALEVQVEDYKIKTAALEKCIEARDTWLLRLESRGIDDVIGCECHDCAEFKSAIRRADEEAGR